MAGLHGRWVIVSARWFGSLGDAHQELLHLVFRDNQDGNVFAGLVA
jgi:hypothetical protein